MHLNFSKIAFRKGIFYILPFLNRYKEGLICELVKSDKEAKEMKKQYSEKIRIMKQEVEKAKKDLDETKKALEELQSKANFEMSEKQKLENEYKKKLHSVEVKLQALKRKQKVTPVLSSGSFILNFLLRPGVVRRTSCYTVELVQSNLI